MVYITNNKNQIISFSNSEFGKIRTVIINGEPWLIGKDVAVALGYSNASKAVSVHVDEEDKQFIMLDIADSQNGNALKGKSKTTIINESGMYALIFSSKLESAKRFKHWVTSEVLPSIRKTGGYQIPKTAGEQIKLLAQGYQELEQRVDQHEEKIDEILKRLDVVGAYDNEWMLAKIRQATSSHVMQLTANQTYRTLWARYFYVGIYKMLKSIYRVSSIKSIPSEALEDVLNLIHTWKPSFTFIDQRVQEMEEKQKKNLLSDKKVIAFLQYMQLTNNGAINPWQ